MKKLVLVFSFLLMFAVFQVPAQAAASDYATVIWEQVSIPTYDGEPQIIKVTLTGVVGKQIDSHRAYVADMPITLLKDVYIETSEEAGSFLLYHDDGSTETMTLEALIAQYGTNVSILPVVESGQIIIEQVKKADDYGYEGYPGSYDFVDDENTVVVRGMGQAGNFSVGENSVKALQEGKEMNSYALEIPVADANGNAFAVLTVSEEKAAELLATIKDSDVAEETTDATEEVEPVVEETELVTEEKPATEAKPVQEAVAPNGDQYEVTIQLGDTVGLLSVRYYGDYTMINEIYAANKAYFAKTGDKLNKGDTLVLPKAPTCQVPEASETVKVYTVKAGDTLATIAYKFYKDGSKYNVIFEANKDKLAKASLIYEGQILAIPVVK